MKLPGWQMVVFVRSEQIKPYPLLSARNDGDCLQWEVHEYVQEVSEDIVVTAETTSPECFGLASDEVSHYPQSHGDCGGPETLAEQIKWWKASISSKF